MVGQGTLDLSDNRVALGLLGSQGQEDLLAPATTALPVRRVVPDLPAALDNQENPVYRVWVVILDLQEPWVTLDQPESLELWDLLVGKDQRVLKGPLGRRDPVEVAQWVRLAHLVELGQQERQVKEDRRGRQEILGALGPLEVLGLLVFRVLQGQVLGDLGAPGLLGGQDPREYPGSPGHPGVQDYQGHQDLSEHKVH